MTSNLDGLASQRPFVFADAMTLLARTPATLDVLLRGLPDAWIHANEGPNTWSAFDVVGHLIHADRTNWLSRARMILGDGEAQAFEDFNRTAMFGQSAGRSLESLLDEFSAVRRESLRELALFQLTESDLDRRGRHPTFGVVTLRNLLSTWVAHDLDHLVQTSRVLASQYRDVVGPWTAFLRVLRERP